MSSLFGGGQDPVPAPTPLPPPTMPDPSSPENIAAGRTQARQNAARDGRLSTILSTVGTRTPTIAGGSKTPAAAGTPAPVYSSTSL